jgi:hypothetical protein
MSSIGALQRIIRVKSPREAGRTTSRDIRTIAVA